MVKKTDEFKRSHDVIAQIAADNWFETNGTPLLTDETMTAEDWDAVCAGLLEGELRCFKVAPPETKESLAQQFIEHAARHGIRLAIKSMDHDGLVCAKITNSAQAHAAKQQEQQALYDAWNRWSARLDDLIGVAPAKHWHSLKAASQIAYHEFDFSKKVPEQSPEELIEAVIRGLESPGG